MPPVDFEGEVHRLIDAWESLPGGINYGPREIERWLADKMAPAIRHARKTTGRKAPNED